MCPTWHDFMQSRSLELQEVWSTALSVLQHHLLWVFCGRLCPPYPASLEGPIECLEDIDLWNLKLDLDLDDIVRRSND